jgi:hypothetical protein
VFQPYEDLLPYDDFSVRLPAADIPHIRTVLEAVSEAEWSRLHTNLATYHRAFVWEASAGGLAYNYTIASLRRRLHYMRGSMAVD